MPKNISLKTADLDEASAVAAWNALFPVGTEIRYEHPSLLKRCVGFTREPARLRGDGVAAVWVAGAPHPLRLTRVVVVAERPVDPCMVCKHPRETHGLRYSALQGDHEWIDPRQPVVRVAEPRTVPDPYVPQPDREQEHAWAVPNDRPSGMFARIAAAARRSA